MTTATRTLSELVAHRVIKARLAAGLTQAQLADLLGVTQAALSYWEHGGRKIGLDELERIADALGLSLTYFVENHD